LVHDAAGAPPGLKTLHGNRGDNQGGQDREITDVEKL